MAPTITNGKTNQRETIRCEKGHNIVIDTFHFAQRPSPERAAVSLEHGVQRWPVRGGLYLGEP